MFQAKLCQNKREGQQQGAARCSDIGHGSLVRCHQACNSILMHVRSQVKWQQVLELAANKPTAWCSCLLAVLLHSVVLADSLEVIVERTSTGCNAMLPYLFSLVICCCLDTSCSVCLTCVKHHVSAANIADLSWRLQVTQKGSLASLTDYHYHMHGHDCCVGVWLLSKDASCKIPNYSSGS